MMAAFAPVFLLFSYCTISLLCHIHSLSLCCHLSQLFSICQPCSINTQYLYHPPILADKSKVGWPKNTLGQFVSTATMLCPASFMPLTCSPSSTISSLSPSSSDSSTLSSAWECQCANITPTTLSHQHCHKPIPWLNHTPYNGMGDLMITVDSILLSSFGEQCRAPPRALWLDLLGPKKNPDAWLYGFDGYKGNSNAGKEV